MAFATRTYEQIRDGYLRDVRISNPTARTEEGSHEWARANAIANSLLPLYANGAYFSKQAFPDTGDEETLARWGSVTGVARLGEQFSSGTITVAGSYATTIADGATLVNKANGSRYQTVGTTTIDAVTLEATAYVIAMQSGSGSDAEVGTVIAWEGAPPGIDTNATVISISGGDAAWSDARWAVEIEKRLRQTPQGGNVAHLLALCTTIAGVEQAFIYPALRGAGTFDIVITTSQASGTRVAGTSLITKVLGALQAGSTALGGIFLAGVPEDVFDNVVVHAVVEQDTDILIEYEASGANAWADWPPPASHDPSDTNTWYVVTGTPTSNTSFQILKPVTGTAVAPTAGDEIAAFFPDVGFAKTTVTSYTDGGLFWTVSTQAWTPAPTDLLTNGTPILPWCAELPSLAGEPDEDSQALSGAVPEFFAALGPGEMTTLTADDVTRRRRWPRPSDTNPVSGEVEWPTDVTSRLTGAVLRAVDAPNVTVSAYLTNATPTVPAPGHLGSPPSVLVLRNLFVIPTT